MNKGRIVSQVSLPQLYILFHYIQSKSGCTLGKNQTLLSGICRWQYISSKHSLTRASSPIAERPPSKVLPSLVECAYARKLAPWDITYVSTMQKSTKGFRQTRSYIASFLQGVITAPPKKLFAVVILKKWQERNPIFYTGCFSLGFTDVTKKDHESYTKAVCAGELYGQGDII